MLCLSCLARFPFREGFLDMVGTASGEVITPFQRLMQSKAIVSIYENRWRRLGYFIASSRSFARELETVLGFARGRLRRRVLDLACGPGVFTRPLACETQATVVGIDLSRPMLLHARRLIDRDGLQNIRLIRGTAFRLPFVAGAFEYVNCCGALHLFDSPDAALDEIARVLAPGGHLCVQTTLRPEHSGGTAYVLERFIRFGFFAQAELHDKIFRRGFKILQSERNRISYTFLCRFLP
jgi:ubiquinone/menaquinone biosynthesis C-methylase UbiE